MIKAGMSSSCLYPLETELSLKMLGENGIRTVEVFFNAESELKGDFVAELKSIVDYYGIDVVSLHPTMSLAESFMLYSAYSRRTEEGKAQYARYGEIASELGAKYIIMHGGKPNGVLDDRGYFERFAEISDIVAASGTTLLQENVANFRAGKLCFLSEMVNYLGDKAAFCLDIKQCIRNGYTPFEYINAVGKNVKHIHISDHTPLNDCMLPGKGDFNFGKLFRKMEEIGYSGAAITEVYRSAFGEYSEIFSNQEHFCAKILENKL